MKTVTYIFFFSCLFFLFVVPHALATETTTSWKTCVGNPPDGCNSNNNQGSSTASDLSQSLVHAVTMDTDCPKTSLRALEPDTGYFRRVEKRNFNCINSVHYKERAIPRWEEIKNIWEGSANAHTFLQCVGFAQSVLLGSYGKKLDPEVNAKNFADFPSRYTDYTWIENPTRGLSDFNSPPLLDNIQPGDVIIWRSESFGHIAIVTQVSKPKKINNLWQVTFMVAEGNGRGEGEVDFTPYSTNPFSSFHVVGWFRKKV